MIGNYNSVQSMWLQRNQEQTTVSQPLELMVYSKFIMQQNHFSWTGTIHLKKKKTHYAGLLHKTFHDNHKYGNYTESRWSFVAD